MCIIISKPPEKILDKDIYDECFWRNDHGGGFAYIDDGKLVVKKGFKKFKEMYEAIQAVEDKIILLHFRRASPGMDVSEAMCHPFEFTLKSHPDEHFAVVHNGRLRWRSTKEVSDTAFFVTDLLIPFLEGRPDLLEDQKHADLFEMAMGYENKIVILRYNSTQNVYWTYYLNKHLGQEPKEHEGVWFSNDSWKKYVPTYGAHGSYQKNFDGFEYDPETGTYKSTKNSSPNGYHGKTQTKIIPPTPHLPLAPVTPIAQGSEDTGCNPFLAHLTKPHRKLLRRLAAEHLKAIKMNMQGMSEMEKIQWLRVDWRQNHPTEMTRSQEEIDRQIIAAKMGEKFLDTEPHVQDLDDAAAGTEAGIQVD